MSKHEKPIVPSSINKVYEYYKNPNSIIFEIGAFDGVDIDEIKNLWSNSIIHAFEPDEEVFSTLNTYSSKEVICNNVALSNIDGKLIFRKYLQPGTSNEDRSLWHKTIQSLKKASEFHKSANGSAIQEIEVEVESVTLNNYCITNNVSPDIILMDTQGSEWEILDGARDILKNVKIILLEWSTIELYEEQKMLNDIKILLEEYDFELIEKINLWEEMHGDAIFIKKI